VVWAFDQNEGIAGVGQSARPVARPRPQHSALNIWLAERWQEVLAQDSERIVLWLPVGFGFGAGLTCSLRADDPALLWTIATFALLGLWLIALILAQRASNHRCIWILTWLSAFSLLGAAFSGGGAAGLLRAQAVAAPVIGEATGAREIVGYVHQVDKSQRGAWRALISVNAISGVQVEDQPAFVRISLKQDEPPLPGTAVSCTAVLRPPPGPVVPGAYDHSRRAWFQRLGGVGFALKPCQVADLGRMLGAMRLKLMISQKRAEVSRAIVEAAPGPGAGFLAAITTGDRAWLSPEDTAALQISGLSHIISVSGLHVALLGGMVFVTIWKMLALIPALALRVDARKVAAFVALILTGSYTIFSGAEAPAVRAFIMSAIAFGAVILDRKAISMRALALAAIAVLVVLPESALEPGFQMSFLATAALVAMWEIWERHGPGETRRSLFRTILLWIAAAAGTSFVAGLATAPIAAATFQRLSPWSVPANLLAAPINDFIVAPAAMIAAGLSVFGLGDMFWQIASWGLSLNLKIAHFIAVLPGASTRVPWTDAFPPVFMIFASLWLTLWRSWLRYLGVVLFLMGAVIWTLAPKPVGWIGPEARAILATPKQGGPQLCQTSGGRFDASRLMDHAGLSDAEASRLMPGYFFRRACTLGEGDWQGRYIEAGSGRAILSITLDGRAFAFGPGDIPDGALLMRDGWRVYLADSPRRQGPWAHQNGR
jgi:competence protein ComEC